ncbi:hypothetical protein K505DRAFT_147820 [Melanomma pulvis-pyrius CBS 109.77]|uniref:Galactose oxidase n=1 Tax=Melanomma pulvis-pyrius CBS 109.77 TaxID=1314802 RepID=A0A6A6WQG1_9PLEO|nr:hypothetical protein K505DRAFT_147820 [Melanomma pulvis-pyrius CBS 109.77]
MGLPQPVYELSGHCSVIYNNTLYAYSPAGFQSLELTEGAKWKELPMDMSLTGAQCVKAVKDGDQNGARLYIVGGTTNATAAKMDYPGLMKYTFSQNKWDWVEPDVRVTKDRLNHGAAYLPASNSLLVYSGSQEPGNVIPSDQTFTISTETPFRTQGFQGQGAPPVLKPMLMPWDDNHAVMFGGSATNKDIFLFDSAEGWQNLGVALEQGIQNQDQVQCTVVSGDDGSKVLETYDMSVTPNKVTRVALLKKGGEKADPGQTIGDKAKRLLTIDQWPEYNGTLAPTATRAGYSIAQNDDDLAVISGGSVEDPLCIFDQKANTWVNTTELFAGQQVVIQSEPTLAATISSTLVPTATGSSLPSASTDASGAGGPAPVNNKSRMLTVLAATLGAIFGIAALLILLLFFLKYKKSKNRKAQQTGYIEKDRLSFADRGAEFMSEAGGSVGQNYSASMNASHSSLAIINQGATNHKRGLGPQGSDASTAGLVMKKSPLGYSEPVELSKFDMKPEPVVAEKLVRQNSNAAPRPPPSRSSGWSRYFANNEATNLAHMSSGRSTFASERTSTGSQSLYTDSRMYSQPPAAIAPLDIPKFDGQHINRVPTGSPTLGNSRENLHVPMESMQAELARADSNGSARSGISRDDHYERTPMDSWTPMGNATATTTYDRPPSSNYGDNHRDGASSYYPDATNSYYPKSGYSSFFAPGQLGTAHLQERESTVTVFPGGKPKIGAPNERESTGTMFPIQPPLPLGAPQDRESTFTIFPGGAPPENQPKKDQPDMSWLNLGHSNNR